MLTQSASTSATERLVRAALTFHRLALAADEVQHIRSPATRQEPNAKGVADPTANTAMCPRRAAVADALDEATREAARLSALLAEALDTWDGRGVR